MKLMRTMELLNKYSTCQQCGSEMIGDGAGTLEVTENKFSRTCKCGWKVEISDADQTGGTIE